MENARKTHNKRDIQFYTYSKVGHCNNEYMEREDTTVNDVADTVIRVKDGEVGGDFIFAMLGEGNPKP